MGVENIILRLRLKGQAATNAGLVETTRAVNALNKAADRHSLSTFGGVLLTIPPGLLAIVGPVAALTSALSPLIGVAAAAGEGLLGAGQAAGVFALATNGIDKALKAVGNPKAYAAALNSLPPAARSFTRSLVSMKPLLDDLRQTAAAGFLPGAEKGLASAARNFGPLQRIVAVTATVLGNLAAAAGRLIGSPAFGRDLETIGSRNAKVIDTLGRGALHLVSALRYVLLAAGPLTSWLADTAGGWAKNAASSAKAGQQSGKLAAFFERTRKILERLGSIISHVTLGLVGIGRAGTDSGNSMWASIDRLAQRFDKWANSVKGQRDIKRFFEESRQLAAALIPVLGGVVQGLTLLSLRLLPLTTALQLLGSSGARTATIAFIGFKLAATAATVVTRAWLAATIAARWAVIAFRVALYLAYPAVWALNGALAANPIVAVVLLLAALAAGLYYAYTHSEKFRNAVNALASEVSKEFAITLNAVRPLYDWVADHWPLLLGILVGPFTLASVAIKEVFNPVLDFLKDRLNNVIDIINFAIQQFNKLPLHKDLGLIGHVGSNPPVPKVGHRALGGPTPAGDYWVGERGPEIVRFPSSGHVYDAGTSAAMVSGGKQSVGRTLVTHVSVILDNAVVGKATATQWADEAAFA